MTTTEADIELAVTHLNRAVEKARFFGHSQAVIDRLSLLKRAAVDVQDWVVDERKH